MDSVNIRLLNAYGAVKPCDGTIVSPCYFRRADVLCTSGGYGVG